MNTLKKKVAIRTRAGLDYGWGHLARSLRLAQKIIKNFPKTEVSIVYSGINKIPDYLKFSGLNLHPFEICSDHDEKRWVKELSPEIIFIDMLKIPDELLNICRSNCQALVAFNDMGYEYNQPDFVICPQLLEKYPCPVANQLCLNGLDYFIVPELFETGEKIIFREQVESILVVLGGALPENVEGWLIAVLIELQLLPYKIKVVTGFAQAGELAGKQHEFNDHIEFISNVNDLPLLMMEADLAIAASGYVKMELAAAGTPTLLVSIVDHQDILGRTFAEKTGAASYLGNINELTPQHIILETTKLANDPGLRQIMSEAGRKHLDGRGAERIIQACFN